MALSQADWDEMRSLAWAWDPLGLGADSRFVVWREYDSIIRQTAA